MKTLLILATFGPLIAAAIGFWLWTRAMERKAAQEAAKTQAEAEADPAEDLPEVYGTGYFLRDLAACFLLGLMFLAALILLGAYGPT